MPVNLFLPNTVGMLVSILDMEKVTVDDIMVPHNTTSAALILMMTGKRLCVSNHAPHAQVIIYKGIWTTILLGFCGVREAFRLMLEKNEFTKEMLLRATDEVYLF